MEQATLIAPLSPPTPSEGLEEMRVRELWKFRVEGEAVPQGSMKATLNRYTGRVVMFPSNNKALKAWREKVADSAQFQKPPWLREPRDGAVYVALAFVRERGDDYLADGHTLKKGARRYPDTAPDIDKLTRSCLDALTGVAFTNDARVVTCLATKRYAELGERAHVDIDIGFL
jgi:crossover junction endodeoxyribonuclease RusA